MAAVTVYAQSAGNWDKSNNWNTVAGGGGTAYTDPQDGTDAFTCDLNGYAVTLNKTVVVTKIQAGAAGGSIVVPTAGTPTIGNASGVKTFIYSSYATAPILTWTDTGSLTLNGRIEHNSAATAGMMTVGTNQTITIQNTGGSGTVSVTQTANTGYALVASGSGTFVISNSGGTAILNSSGGRGVSSVSTSASLSVTGLLKNTGSGAGLFHQTGAGTIAVTGNCESTASGVAIQTAAATVNWSGISISSNTNVGLPSVTTSSGTWNWTGTHNIANATDGYVQNNGATFNAGTAGTALVLNNNGGRYIIANRSGTTTTTYLTINNTVVAAQTCVMGQVFQHTGPTLPAVEDVDSGVTYGYSGTVLTGTLAAGGGGGVPVFGGSVVRRV